MRKKSQTIFSGFRFWSVCKVSFLKAHTRKRFFFLSLTAVSVEVAILPPCAPFLSTKCAISKATRSSRVFGLGLLGRAPFTKRTVKKTKKKTSHGEVLHRAWNTLPPPSLYFWRQGMAGISRDLGLDIPWCRCVGLGKSLEENKRTSTMGIQGKLSSRCRPRGAFVTTKVMNFFRKGKAHKHKQIFPVTARAGRGVSRPCGGGSPDRWPGVKSLCAVCGTQGT